MIPTVLVPDDHPRLSTLFALLATASGRNVIHQTFEAALFAGQASVDYQVHQQTSELVNKLLSFDFDGRLTIIDRDIEAEVMKARQASQEASEAAISGVGQAFEIADKTQATARYKALCSELTQLREAIPGAFLEIYSIVSKEFGELPLELVTPTVS